MLIAKIKSFTDLHAWQEGHLLVLDIYKITKTFPVDERFGLIDQMRRCSVSITSNIAEGFSRKGKKEKIQFLFLALGSLTELQNQLLVARDVGYISHELFKRLADKTVVISKLTNGLIKSSHIHTT
ncbi:MAG: four helix bundle protein [Candidatus Levybacteria bacterium]|nr:four helix bundle protein [Candidatus Levybacteria bacterium]